MAMDLKGVNKHQGAVHLPRRMLPIGYTWNHRHTLGARIINGETDCCGNASCVLSDVNATQTHAIRATRITSTAIWTIEHGEIVVESETGYMLEIQGTASSSWPWQPVMLQRSSRS